LDPGAELIAWDVAALGLPTSNLSFTQGHFQQHLEISGVWLEKGNIRGSDTRWLNSPLGLAGQKCLASLVFAAGTAIEPKRAEKALEAAREVIEAHPFKHQAGITCAHPQVLVLRVMSPLVEPTMDLLKQVWASWRHTLWALPSSPPRIWSV
jgi:urease accessory protein